MQGKPHQQGKKNCGGGESCIKLQIQGKHINCIELVFKSKIFSCYCSVKSVGRGPFMAPGMILCAPLKCEVQDKGLIVY